MEVQFILFKGLYDIYDNDIYRRSVSSMRSTLSTCTERHAADEVLINLNTIVTCEVLAKLVWKVSVVHMAHRKLNVGMFIATGDIQPSQGDQRKSHLLRVGRYAQHFVDALNMEETPVEYLLNR